MDKLIIDSFAGGGDVTVHCNQCGKPCQFHGVPKQDIPGICLGCDLENFKKLNQRWRQQELPRPKQ